MNPKSIHHHTPYVLKSILLFLLIILSPARKFSVKSTPVEQGFCPPLCGRMRTIFRYIKNYSFKPFLGIYRRKIY